jgi:hypothetical protein
VIFVTLFTSLDRLRQRYALARFTDHQEKRTTNLSAQCIAMIMCALDDGSVFLVSGGLGGFCCEALDGFGYAFLQAIHGFAILSRVDGVFQKIQSAFKDFCYV